MSKAVFPGTFDPPTLGHLDIIRRASQVFSKVYILIAINDQKKPLLEKEERFFLLKELVSSYLNVEVILWDNLIIDFLEIEPSFTLVRGVRNLQDFSLEWDMFIINNQISSQKVDTFWIPCQKEYVGISSSLVRSLLLFKRSVRDFVPFLVADYLDKRE